MSHTPQTIAFLRVVKKSPCGHRHLKEIPSSQYRPADQLPVHPQDLIRGPAMFVASDPVGDADSKEVSLKRKQDIFMRAFAGNLKADGLRSPQYYRDKSQCLSVHENASPAEMGYLKARSLKRGYVDAEELIDRLRALKPSENFTLRNERYRREAQNHWQKLMEVEQTPLPDLHLLEHMGWSPSGTLFPRSLVKGLHALREAANDRGIKYYDEEYDTAEIERGDAIQRWQKKNSSSVLANDPISIYRTWPSDLMNQLDAADCEGIQRGCARYMADLCETEGKMQLLVTFWNDCGLVTGQRTPPSPQWPDPKAKLRGVSQPQYLKDRLQTMSMEYQQHKN